VIVAPCAGALAILASRPQALLGAVPLVGAVTAISLVKAPRRARSAADLALAALLGWPWERRRSCRAWSFTRRCRARQDSLPPSGT
jgi:hypothetical protein